MELAKLEHFFRADIMIKKEMINLYPKSFASDYAIVEYMDNAYDTIKYIFSELKCFAIDIFGMDSFTYKMVVEKEKRINDIIPRIKTINDARIFYEKFISEMKLDFLTSVSSNLKGYYVFSNPIDPLNKITTINEMLHFMHAYVMNNDRILKSIPQISSKINNNNRPISLRGEKNEFFATLFMDFPLNLDVGTTDMVVISEDKMIMMIRDLGHALTMEISLKNDTARVEYFIPKAWNEEMIRKLPGFQNLNENNLSATGVIEVPKNELSTALFDFISKVPDDQDFRKPTLEEMQSNPIRI